MRIRTIVFAFAGGLLCMAPPLQSSVQAKSLSPEECGVLRQQRQELETKGLGQTVIKGPAWASENLTAAQISEVGVFLKLMEKINFRCSKTIVDAKSKFGVHDRIPLPVRNSRRLKQKDAKVNTKTVVPAVVDGKMAPEIQAVLSAITQKGSEKPAVSGANVAGPPMRKSISE